MVSCLLLSAGLSTRFGAPKALARINGKTVIEHVQNSLIHSKTDEIVIVLGDRASDIEPHILNHRKIKVVYNKDYISGQTSSFQAGLRAISPESRGIMLLPIDVPSIKSTTLDFLIEEFIKKEPLILIPSYHGKKGHPPFFSSKLKGELLEMDIATGLNTFERQHEPGVTLVSVEDDGILRTFNTQAEFEKIKTSLRLES